MAVDISAITTNNWQMSLSGLGDVVQEVDDIKQCIGVILMTPKGSQPLRPLFGSDLYEWIDKPINVAVPNMTQAITDAIGIWETRVELVSISHAINVSNVTFTIDMEIKGRTGTVRIVLLYNTTRARNQSFSNAFSIAFS